MTIFLYSFFPFFLYPFYYTIFFVSFFCTLFLFLSLPSVFRNFFFSSFPTPLHFNLNLSINQ